MLLCWLLFTDDCKLKGVCVWGGLFSCRPFESPPWPLVVPLSLILHPPADQMFISDAADKAAEGARRELSLTCIFFFFQPFTFSVLRWGKGGGVCAVIPPSAMVNM